MLVADFLISPEAQARKSDESVWGDPTVLNLERLPATDRAPFEALQPGAATPSPPDRLLAEPHPSWAARLEREWLERYVR
jgi:putative thiamine transport system substrate-binding protein